MDIDIILVPEVHSFAAVGDGIVVFGSADGRVYALHRARAVNARPLTTLRAP